MTSFVHPAQYSAGMVGQSGVGRAINSFAFVLLWLFVFTVPWGDGMRESAGLAFSHMVGFAAFGVGAFSVLVGMKFRKPVATHYMLLTWVTWSALTYLWSFDRDATAIRIGTYLQLLGMVWLIWESATTTGRQLSLLSAYVLGTFVSCSETIGNFLSGRTVSDVAMQGTGLDPSTEQRFVADGFNANEFALVLAISVPITFYLLAQKRKGSVQFLYWLQFLAAVSAILLTGSRGALMAAAVGSLMYFFAFRNAVGWQRYGSMIMLPLAVIVAFLVVPDTVLHRFTTIESEVTQGTLTKRTFIWSAGLETFRDHAMGGVGAGAFGASVMSRLDVPYAAHNTFLSVLVELGVIGSLLFGALLVTLMCEVAHLPPLTRYFWLFLLATWCIGIFTTTWEQRKPTWFLFAMLPAQASTMRQLRAQRKSMTYPEQTLLCGS